MTILRGLFMVGPCSDNRFRWFLAKSWSSIKPFCPKDANRVLAKKPELKIVFDTIQTEAVDPKSIVRQLLQISWVRQEQIKIFLHPGHYKSTVDTFYLNEAIPFYGGIHVYHGNTILDGKVTTIPLSIIDGLVHELWHLVTKRYALKNDMMDIGQTISESGNAAWSDPSAKEAAFEEAFASILGTLIKQGDVKYNGNAKYVINHKVP